MVIEKSKQDIIGALTSFLCFVHCASTPFLLTLLSTANLSNSIFLFQWWGVVDLFLLIISLFAVIYSARHTAKQWVAYALWISWMLLAITIFNEKLGWIHFPEMINYLPALFLIYFHIYNRKHCQCGEEHCCIEE